MGRFFKVGENDFVDVARITNLKIHRTTVDGDQDGEQTEQFIVCCYVDYGYAKDSEGNALYALGVYDDEAEAVKVLKDALEACGGVVGNAPKTTTEKPIFSFK